MSEQYVATCEEEHISLCGIGDTPDEAFQEFMSNGEFEEHCDNNDVESGEQIEVSIMKIITFEEADEDEQSMMLDEGWQWMATHTAETRMVAAPEINDE